MTAFRRTRSALAAGLLVLAAAAPAFAQQKQIRVAVVDPSRVFNEMQETKELRGALEAERQRLQATSKEKEAEIENLQKQRKLTKPDTQQAEDLNNQLMQKAMEYDLWSKYAKMNAERAQKKQMRTLFAKIESATGDVAKQQGIDLVITQQSPELPESLDQISVDQVRAILNSRHVLYASDAADVSSAVIALLDSRFKAAGGGAAAPAPGKAPAPAAK